MNSTIKIALGENNEPVIHFNIVPSDDIRDQLCCQFMHRLEGVSTTCKVSIEGNDNHYSNGQLSITHLLKISPVSPQDLPKERENLPSRYQVDDSVSTEDIFDGQVVGVRFTIGKVYYDILDKLTGKVIRDVDSSYILPEPTIKLSQVVE